MMNGIVIRRGKEFLARKRSRKTPGRKDQNGMCWSEDIQTARVFQNYDTACRTARRVGGTVRMMTDGRVVE